MTGIRRGAIPRSHARTTTHHASTSFIFALDNLFKCANERHFLFINLHPPIPCCTCLTPYPPSTLQQKMAHAYNQDIAERDYTISSTQLELANARRHIKVLEVQRSALSDDVETARTEYEVLVAQLAEEQDSGDALKNELSTLRKALQHAAQGLAEADGEISRLSQEAQIAKQYAERKIADEPSKGNSQTLARAEARLEEVTRGEAALEQRLIFEREAKEALEESVKAERAAATRAADDANRSAGEAAALRRELTEQKGAQHELQRLLAERNGAIDVLKGQLADAEGKYESGRVGTEPELRGRLHEVERRANEMARELGAKGAALQALERQLGERTAEAATEQMRAERSRTRVRELEAELRNERSKESSSNGGSEFSGRGTGTGAALKRGKEKPSPAARPSPPRFPKSHVTSRHKEVPKEKPKEKPKPKPKPKADGPSAAAAAAAAAVAAAAELETDMDGGSLGSLFAKDAANATVVNVLDHLSLSGYVSPLAKIPGGVRAGEEDNANANAKDASEPIAKAKAKSVAAAFEKEANGSDLAEPLTSVDPSESTLGTEASAEQPSKETSEQPSKSTIDIAPPLDPDAFDDDASTEEIETEDTGEEVGTKNAVDAVPERITRGSAKKEKETNNTAGPSSKKPPTVTPGRPPRAGKTPKGKLIGGLRMPLANIGQKKRAGDEKSVSTSDASDGKAAADGGRKKRRLLNQVTVGGETPGKHPSLLFGVGEGFDVPKP